MKGELKMDVNDYLPLRDVVFNTLRQAILRGEMEPGERLMEIQLADKLGVSRTPIRAGGTCYNDSKKGSRGCPYNREGHERCS